jgi:hypothetical protein
MFQYGHVIALNIVQVANNGAQFQTIPKEMSCLAGVPIGKYNGVFCFNSMAKSEPSAFVQKCDIRALNMGVYRNDPVCIAK